MEFCNGDQYDGHWEDDRMDGEGTYVFASGDRFVGSFSQGRRQGFGTLKVLLLLVSFTLL
jgi:hypothetical protein